MLRHAFYIILVVVSCLAQDGSLMDLQGVAISIKGFGRGSPAQLNLENAGAVYCVNSGLISGRNAMRNFVRDNLGGNYGLNISYHDLDTTQYEMLCKMFGLVARPSQTMLVLYFNNNAVQFPFERQEINFVQEFKKLGWLPLSVNLENFLNRNPYNQDALATLFQTNITNLNKLVLQERISLLDSSLATMARSQLGLNDMPDSNTLPSLIKTFEMINSAGKLDWMFCRSGATSLAIIRRNAAAVPSLLESREFQQALSGTLALIENEIARYPFSPSLYSHWASFANMAQSPDPRKILSQISFPPGSRAVPSTLYLLATPFFLNITIENNFVKFLSGDGFQFFNDLEEWMEAQDQDIYKGGVFSEAFLQLAIEKSRQLIRFHRHSEIEKYLESLRYKLGSNWPKFVSAIKLPMTSDTDIKNLPNLNKIEEILGLPTIEEGEKRFNAILVLHNFSQKSFDKLNNALIGNKMHFYTRQDTRLPKNSWLLKNANVQITSGSIVPDDNENTTDNPEEVKELLEIIHKEEFKNLNALERFIQQNPENFDAMDMYIEEAARFLPNEALENKTYVYSAKTGTPPSIQAYSKMSDKENWSHLASRMIIQELIRLKDALSVVIVGSAGTRSPWFNLSSWEVFDINKTPVDYYGFFKDTDSFWHKPIYYTQQLFMPETIFIKYLMGAEKATDWRAVLEACEMRFNDDKKNCRNEQILEAWNKAEKALNTPSLPYPR